MFIDARHIDDKSVIETDVCIIGAGAAGITLALQLINVGIKVHLLEAGFFEVDRKTQGLQKVTNVGRRYHALRFSRPRYLGGATNVWGGHCVPLRTINFEQTPWIPHSGWPFSRDELQPYYERAHEVLQLGEYEYDPIRVSDRLALPLFPFDPHNVETVLSRYTGRSRLEAASLGMLYRGEIARARNVTACLGANVTSINRHPNHDYIVDVSVRTLKRNEFSVRAKYYFLAAGGIENARLLLLSDGIEVKGLGNQNDLVGRYFMEHISYRSGIIIPLEQHQSFSLYGATHVYGSTAVRCHLALPEPVIRKHQIPDFRTEIIVNSPTKFDYLVSKAHELRERMKDFDLLDSSVILALKGLRKMGKVSGKLDQPGRPRGPIVYRLDNYVEQVPNPDSRVFLLEQRDAFGLRRIALDWRLSAIDKEGLRIAHSLIAKEVEGSGFGKMIIELPEEEEVLFGANGGGHHMGTTRMHASARQGVVDANCRIHGLQNIFVAGSSVFPTGGYANPTLTIVALAIRLADHLKSITRWS
jgi:choline dehydrogenase-like flavoprotein